MALNFDQVENALNRKTYTAHGTSALPGRLLCTETTNPCARSNIDAKQAHTYAGDTYSFYKSKHDRDSLDNAGMPLISTVDYCPKPAECPMRNAFWNSERQQMIYGDRIMADDVVGHELPRRHRPRVQTLLLLSERGDQRVVLRRLGRVHRPDQRLGHRHRRRALEGG